MTGPRFPDSEDMLIVNGLLKPQYPDRLPQQLFAIPYFQKLREAREYYRTLPEERAEEKPDARGYFGEEIASFILNDYFRNHGINLEVERASTTFDNLDQATSPANGNEQQSSQGASEKGKKYLPSEFNKTADLIIHEVGGPSIMVDTTLSPRSMKLRQLTKKARNVRHFEHQRLGKFAVFVISLNIPGWDETFEQVSQQLDAMKKNREASVDPKSLKINEGRVLIGRFLDQLRFDIRESLGMNKNEEVVKTPKLPKDLFPVAIYFYNKTSRIYNALDWVPQYTTV